jgi:hypothetical protein
MDVNKNNVDYIVVAMKYFTHALLYLEELKD